MAKTTIGWSLKGILLYIKFKPIINILEEMLFRISSFLLVVKAKAVIKYLCNLFIIIWENSVKNVFWF